MTDEARIARLTELARRVWPDEQDVRVYANWRGHASVTCVESPCTRARLVSVESHPRALDALEAALLVLAGDSDFYKRNYEHAEEECTAEREMAQQLEAKLAKVQVVVDAWNRPASRQDSKAGVEVLLVQLLAILDEAP